MKKKIEITRPPLESLACVSLKCKLYGQAGQGNLTVRKVYGKDQIRYLRCCECQTQFSERTNTTLWNCKILEEKAISIAEHLSEDNSIKRTARLVRIAPSRVRRLNQRSGQHGEQYYVGNFSLTSNSLRPYDWDFEQAMHAREFFIFNNQKLDQNTPIDF